MVTVRRACVGAVMSAVLAAALMLVMPSSATAAESNGGHRIMPLGDSITWGGDWGSYRVKLWRNVEAGGYKVDFVGSNNNGPAATLPDRDNEGHSGIQIAGLDAGIAGWVATARPQTVLLHAGTNDVYRNSTLTQAPARLSALIDKIRAGAPDAHIFVATIIPFTDPVVNERAKTFNAAVPGVVASKGSKVHLVDMHSALTAADLYDGIHPTTQGFDKMADVWYAAMLKVPGSMGTSSTTGVAQNYRLADTNQCLDVYYALGAPLTPTQTWTCHGNANQKWTRTAAGELRVYGTSCLDLYGRVTAAGSPVVIYPCHGGANQKWTHRADGTLLHVLSGRCAATTGGSTAQGTRIVLADCSTAASQRWAAY